MNDLIFLFFYQKRVCVCVTNCCMLASKNLLPLNTYPSIITADIKLKLHDKKAFNNPITMANDDKIKLANQINRKSERNKHFRCDNKTHFPNR